MIDSSCEFDQYHKNKVQKKRNRSFQAVILYDQKYDSHGGAGENQAGVIRL